MPGLASTLPRIQLSRSVTVWSRNSCDGDFVAPLAECALGELLDVALVDQRDGLAARFERVADGVADQPLGAEDGDGLDAHAGVGAHFLLAAFEQIVVEELDEAGGIGCCPA